LRVGVLTFFRLGTSSKSSSVKPIPSSTTDGKPRPLQAAEELDSLSGGDGELRHEKAPSLDVDGLVDSDSGCWHRIMRPERTQKN
jgi:hypothetical protein